MEQVSATQLGELQPSFGGMETGGAASTSESASERVGERTKAAMGAVAVEAAGDKVWVERAKEVVRETKNDPNKRLTQISLLREEYMRKRLSRILGGHND